MTAPQVDLNWIGWSLKWKSLVANDSYMQAKTSKNNANNNNSNNNNNHSFLCGAENESKNETFNNNNNNNNNNNSIIEAGKDPFYHLQSCNAIQRSLFILRLYQTWMEFQRQQAIENEMQHNYRAEILANKKQSNVKPKSENTELRSIMEQMHLYVNGSYVLHMVLKIVHDLTANPTERRDINVAKLVLKIHDKYRSVKNYENDVVDKQSVAQKKVIMNEKQQLVINVLTHVGFQVNYTSNALYFPEFDAEHNTLQGLKEMQHTLNSIFWGLCSFDELVHLLKNYSTEKMMLDFEHTYFEHGSDEDGEGARQKFTLLSYFRQQLKKDLSCAQVKVGDNNNLCLIFARNYRNREYFDNNNKNNTNNNNNNNNNNSKNNDMVHAAHAFSQFSKLFYLHSIRHRKMLQKVQNENENESKNNSANDDDSKNNSANDNNININGEMEAEMESFSIQSFLDGYHCYFLHSLELLKYDVSLFGDDRNEENREEIDALERLYQHACHQRMQTVSNLQMNPMNNNSNQKFVSPGKSTKGSLSPVYQFGGGLCYWDKYPFTGASPKVQPFYTDLKREFLNNPYYSLTVFAYDRLVYHSFLKMSKSTKFKAIYCHSLILGIRKGQEMERFHVMTLMTYCNNAALQQRYKQNFRLKNESENFRSLVKRNSYIAHWCRLLAECVLCFGQFMDWNQDFYHGIGVKMIWGSSQLIFTTPVSCSTSKAVARMFSGEAGGMIVKIKKSMDTLNAHYFNCEWVSNFKDESERLLCGTKCEAVDLVLNDGGQRKSYSNVLAAMLLLEHLLMGEYCSDYGNLMSDEVQQILLAYLVKITNVIQNFGRAAGSDILSNLGKFQSQMSFEEQCFLWCLLSKKLAFSAIRDSGFFCSILHSEWQYIRAELSALFFVDVKADKNDDWNLGPFCQTIKEDLNGKLTVYDMREYCYDFDVNMLRDMSNRWNSSSSSSSLLSSSQQGKKVGCGVLRLPVLGSKALTEACAVFKLSFVLEIVPYQKKYLALLIEYQKLDDPQKHFQSAPNKLDVMFLRFSCKVWHTSFGFRTEDVQIVPSNPEHRRSLQLLMPFSDFEKMDALKLKIAAEIIRYQISGKIYEFTEYRQIFALRLFG